VRLRNAVAVGFAGLTFAVAMWTVVPAPNLPLLVLAVAAPELAPYGFVVALAALLLALRAARGRARPIAVVLAALAVGCFAWPLVAAPFAWAGAHRALAAAGVPPLRARSLAAVDELHDVPVPLRGGGALALDLYRPHGSADVPLVVAIYGGAWAFGARADVAPLARWYAARGYAVAAIDYRHAPRHRFPAQLDDVEDALRALAAHARAWHVDPARTALFGRSAGGQLALLAAQRPQPLTVRAVVGYYAPTDLVNGYADPPRPDPAGVRRILSAYLGGPPDAAHRAAYERAAPLAHARTTPSALLVIGDRDQLVLPEFQRAFAARVRAAGTRVVALELPWANHAFDEVDGLGAALTRAATLRFLDATLRS
jgi:acetyl esterase/lipase